MNTLDAFFVESTAFIDWLRQSGTTVSSKIELADLRLKNAGRGVLAKEDIAEDEELFSISRACVLTIETSNLPAEIKAKTSDPWLGLIIAMIYEHELGDSSSWKAYFDVLPNEFDTLMFWSTEELEHLCGSAVTSKIGKSSADQAFQEQVIPLIRQHAEIFESSNLGDAELLTLCHRMGSTIMAYAFDLEKPSTESAKNEEDGWEEDEEESEILPKGMVPLADMLNADADRNNAKLFYEDDKVVMKSICPIKAGEEIFNDYGPLPSADVLRRYGYVTDNYAKYDVVEVSLGVIEKATQEQLGMAGRDLQKRIHYLDEQGVLDTAYDISRPENINSEAQQFPDELCVLLETLVLSEPDFAKLKKNKLPKPTLSPESVKLLREIFRRRTKACTESTTAMKLEQELLAAYRTGNELPADRRKRMAAQVIAGERQVLQEALQTLDEMASGPDESAIDGGRKRKQVTDIPNGADVKKLKG